MPAFSMTNAATKSLAQRRKIALSALAATAGAAALFAFSADQKMEFDPERDLASDPEFRADTGYVGSRALANTIDNYDTDQSHTIPAWYNDVANVWDTLVTDDQPMLWYIPRTGGNTMSKIMTDCLDFVSASSVAGLIEGGLEPTTSLQINELEGGKYINLDMSDLTSFPKAANWGLVQGNYADVISTSHLRAATDLFHDDVNNVHRGRLFVLLRHPVKRAIDLFFYRQKATYDDKNFLRNVATMNLLEYAKSFHHVENYVVRTLVGKNGFDVTPDDVQTAKHILRRKFLVGIAEEKFFDVSVVRFEKYFKWWEQKAVMTNMTVNHCHHKTIKKGGHFGSHPKFPKNSPEYKVLAARNWADMELYMWAKGLFKRQAVLA